MTLIDKAALLNTIATEVHYDSERPLEMYAKLLSVVNDAPTVEAEPVRRGHWEDVDGFDCCSICGRPTHDSHDEYIEFNGMRIIALVKPYYCGYCGAKMDEVEEDAETD